MFGTDEELDRFSEYGQRIGLTLLICAHMSPRLEVSLWDFEYPVWNFEGSLWNFDHVGWNIKDVGWNFVMAGWNAEAVRQKFVVVEADFAVLNLKVEGVRSMPEGVGPNFISVERAFEAGRMRLSV